VVGTALHPSPSRRRGPAPFLLAGLLALLGGCAALQSPAPGSSGAAAAASAPAVPAAATVPAVVADEASSPRGDNGINRDGRVLPLERFVETAPGAVTPADEVVTLNYEQEDLRVVIEQLGDALGLNMVIDPTIDFKVSVRTSANNPLRYADVWPLLRLLCRNGGVTIEQAGNVWRFSRNASTVPVEIVLPGSLDAAVSSEVLQVTPLRFIAVDAVEPLLAPLLQPAGQVIRLGPANLIGISGTPQQLERINALLQVVDDDPFLNQGIHVYQLQNSPAEQVAEELTEVLKLIEGEQSSYQVLGLDRINAVLVVAPAARGFEEVSRWVGILDAASQEQVEQLFVYKVKNLDALKLADTLTQVFGAQDDDDSGRAARSDAAATDSPLQLAVPDATPSPAPFAQAPAAPAAAPAPAPGGAGAEAAVSANITVTIVADEDTNSLLVRATPREYRQLLTTINALDSVPLQVLINAVIGQVTLSDSNQFGIDWARISGNAASGPARLTSRFLPNGILDPATGRATAGSGLVLTRTFMDGAAVIDATLNAIAEDNEVRLLARPTLLAANNQEGEIIVGQAVPVNNGSTATGAGGFVTQNIAYRDVGIELKITPQINEDGYINMEIFQRLSSVQDNASEGVGENPTFVNQEITTTAVVLDQETITLGGLIQEEDSDRQAGVPLLQSIPLLGRAFAYNQLDNTRRELFVILRPQIIYGDQRDAAVQQQLRSSFAEVSKLLEQAGL
jgi:general secretion pathway protein D